MIRPPLFCPRISGATARQHRNWLLKQRASVASQSSSGPSRLPSPTLPPALFTRMSIRPHRQKPWSRSSRRAVSGPRRIPAKREGVGPEPGKAAVRLVAAPPDRRRRARSARPPRGKPWQWRGRCRLRHPSPRPLCPAASPMVLQISSQSRSPVWSARWPISNATSSWSRNFYGDAVLNLVVARGYLAKLLRTPNVARYPRAPSGRHRARAPGPDRDDRPGAHRRRLRSRAVFST